jgi:exodeoxyribonuclease VII large subunit
VEVLASLAQKQQSLIANFRKILQIKKERLFRSQSSYVFRQPHRLYEGLAIKLDKITTKLQTDFTEQLRIKENNVKRLIKALDLLSPLKTMGRGFIYTTKVCDDQKIIKSVRELKAGEETILHYVDGVVRTKLLEVVEGQDA